MRKVQIGKGQWVWEGPGFAFEGPDDHPTNFSPCENCLHRRGKSLKRDDLKSSFPCDFYPDGNPPETNYIPLKDIGHKEGMDYTKCETAACLKVCEHYKHGTPQHMK